MLRTRMMLGLGCLVLILVLMGLYAIQQCGSLGRRIQVLSRSFDHASQSIQEMRRGGQDMTAALLSAVTGGGAAARPAFEAAAGRFRQALAEETGRATATPAEKELIGRLAAAFQDEEARADAFLAAPDPAGAAGREAAARLGRDTGALFDLVDQLGHSHQESQRDLERNSGDDINKTVRTLLLLIGIAVVVAIIASMRLTSGLLNPLVSLTASIQQIGEGNLDQVLPASSNDEIGLLATSFNRMVEQLRQYRAAMSEELMRLNMTIRATLASFPDPIFVLNSQGAVELRNPEADQLAVKLLFSGVTRLPQKVDEKVEEVRATGQDYLPTLFKDAIKFHLDGQDRYFLPRIVLLRDEKKETFGVAVILEDVTRMLLLDDIKSNLIATVSHELKTPLTSVRMALYLMHERTVGPLSDRQSELVSTAREDADRLLKTLNDLLDLAKLEHGSAPLELAAATAPEMTEAALRDVRDVAQAAGITLQVEMQPGLPGVRIDRQRIAYVFDNLLTNAIKYAPAGSRVTVSVQTGRMRDGKAGVRFTVRDRGPGIAPEHQEHLFDRFYRVPGTRKTGAGLGLSIAREIVAAHQGEIGVISMPGKGSEFFFILPQAVALKPAAV